MISLFMETKNKYIFTTPLSQGKRLTQSQSQSQNYFTTGGLPSISSSWLQAFRDSRPVSFLQLNTCRRSLYITSYLTRRLFCILQLLLGLASAVILRSESRGTHDHILLSQIRDSPNLEDQIPVFISPRNRVARLYSQALCSLYVASYDSRHLWLPQLANC
jgi:hypothetical protein